MNPAENPEIPDLSHPDYRDDIQEVLNRPNMEALLDKVAESPEEVLTMLASNDYSLFPEEREELIIEAISQIREHMPRDKKRGVKLVSELKKIDSEAVLRGVINAEGMHLLDHPNASDREAYAGSLERIYGFQPDEEAILNIKKEAVIYMIISPKERRMLRKAQLWLIRWNLQAHETEILTAAKEEMEKWGGEGRKRAEALDRDWEEASRPIPKSDDPLESTMGYERVLREIEGGL